MHPDTFKQRQQQVWATGDFSRVGAGQTLVGELLCEFVKVHSGDQVLDIATGAGNTALAAARRGCVVTGVDFVPALLERGRERAAAERLSVEFRPADAESLPFEDDSFDVVLSTFGAMFAPDPKKAAAEMARVCRPGGKIGMANWTPDGMIGEMFRLNSRFTPPPPGLEPPSLWGVKAKIEERFGAYAKEIRIQSRTARFRAPSPEDWVKFMRTFFGPTMRTFEALEPPDQERLAKGMADLARQYNQSDNGTMLAEGEYCEVLVVRSA
jgi:ubiquinone/menaquinone biosynthesis C-methylase UbiE